MTIQVNNAHTIKLSYSGYNKYTATWVGYEKNTIRRTIHVYYTGDSWEKVALEASQMFTQWLTDTSSHELTHNKCIIDSITIIAIIVIIIIIVVINIIKYYYY